MLSDRLKRHANLKNLTFILSLVMFIWLIWYFYTGYGGPTRTGVLSCADRTARADSVHVPGDYLYNVLPPIANHILICFYAGICVLCLLSFLDGVRTDRHLAAGLLHHTGFHRRSAHFSAGHGTVAHRPCDPVLGERRPRRLHPVRLPEPDRFFLASGTIVLPGSHLEHGRARHRNLRALLLNLR
jgi:hypothetical protein